MLPANIRQVFNSNHIPLDVTVDRSYGNGVRQAGGTSTSRRLSEGLTFLASLKRSALPSERCGRAAVYRFFGSWISIPEWSNLGQIKQPASWSTLSSLKPPDPGSVTEASSDLFAPPISWNMDANPSLSWTEASAVASRRDDMGKFGVKCLSEVAA
jgi:hypothetical protein